MAEVKKVESKALGLQVTDGLLIPDRKNSTVFSSWRIAFFGAILLLIILPLWFSLPAQSAVNQGYLRLFPGDAGAQKKQELFDRTALYQAGDAKVIEDVKTKGLPVYRNLWWDFYPWIPSGLVVTFQITFISITFSLLIGLGAGLGQISRLKILNRLATVYVEVIRGIPLMVQVFFIYFALGPMLKLEDFWSIVLAVSFCYGAYLGEIFRAGLQAVPRGQMEAALALGISRTQALIHVIIPQTFKIVLPAIGNEFIALLKDSSVVSVLALADILRQAKNFGSTFGDYFPPMTLVSLVYLVLTLSLSRGVAILEEKMGGDRAG